MDRREETIRLWFDMWLQKNDLGILKIFSEMPFTRKAGAQNITVPLK